MKHSRPVILVCAFLWMSLGAFAQQVPSSPSRQPDEPQTKAPGQQTQPPAPPQAQPPATQPPSIDEQVKALAQELSLSNDQQAKSRTILEDQRQQAATVIADNTLTRDDKVEKIRAIREATIAKVRGLLNIDQKKKLDQILQEPAQQPPSKEPPK